MAAPLVPQPTFPPSVPPVKRHHWIVRLTHWLTFLLLIGMIASGLQIYTAYARFGERGGPYYAPHPFQDHGFSAWSRLRRGRCRGPTRGVGSVWGRPVRGGDPLPFRPPRAAFAANKKN